ncbi:MAG: UDP-N-acetylmuramoyl-L-alanyl-D-glutamate--2,6-diaminopimelate ligase [Anaerolineae bacterium]|nr:UDP-N-acetylmuramoyl-L-alanyl-D-glutamate--2,6-diaminopimelate ligase [Anaerolineae bacterium]
MKLHAVARTAGGLLEGAPANPQTVITGVTHNSAWVTPGQAFVAMRGRLHDGHRYIPDALARGAVLIVGEGFDGSAALPIPYLKVSDARHTLGNLAAALNDYPCHRLRTIGVTGTKGKTTTAWLIRHLLRAAGHRTGLLSTLGYKLDDDDLHQFPAHFTTPEAPQVQETLARMVTQKCTHAVIEASSEALAQHRLSGTRFGIAVWTNLAPEHLNFHGDMEGYFGAKRMLFDASYFAVLNAADPWGMRLTDRPHATYAVQAEAGAEWWASDISEERSGLTFEVHHPGGTFGAKLSMIGAYNVANAMAAIVAVEHLGVPIRDIRTGLATFAGLPGRMQVLQTTPVRVVLDFAHTPDSLRLALTTLRQTTARRLIVVLGSAGGPRDPSKRAPLGAVAATLADLAIFTEEDCRDTPIYDILNEMKRGADEAGAGNTVLIPNRLEAIAYALGHAEPGDTVAFCGKAGEITLERATETLPWIEESIVRAAMAELGWTPA